MLRAEGFGARSFALALLAGAVVWWVKRPPASRPAQESLLPAPTSPPGTPGEIPDTRFTDITAESGITFVHFNGAYGDKLLPETMGGGVAFFDLDNDGDQDLLFINATGWPWKTPAGPKLPTMALYRNDGQGRFEDVTAGSGLPISRFNDRN